MKKRNYCSLYLSGRSRLPRRQGHGSLAAHLMGFRDRIPLEYGCLSFFNVVCCQVEFFATGRFLVQRSPTECVFVCVCVVLSLFVIRCSNKPLRLKWLGRVRRKKESVGKHNSAFFSIRIKDSICSLPVPAFQEKDIIRCTEFEAGPSVLNHASCSGEASTRSIALCRDGVNEIG
jgi:hypothetical protein